MIVLPYVPLKDCSEYLHFLTDVIQTHKAEQRIALRQVPRQELDYAHIIYETDYARLNNLLRAAIGVEVAVPLWYEWAAINNVAAGATSISVDTRNASYADYAYIYDRDNRTGEVVTISSKSDSNLTVEALNAAYQNAYICPVRLGYITDNSLERIEYGIINLSLTYEITETEDIAAGQGTQYLGFDVWPTCSLYDTSEQVTRNIDTVDNDIGFADYIATTSYMSSISQLKIYVDGMAELRNLRKWLYKLRGQQRSFWLESYNPDYTVTQAITATDTTIIIDDVGAALITGQRYAVLKKDDVSYYVTITNATSNGDGTETLTLTEAIGTDIGIPDQMSEMRLFRLSSDDVEIDHTNLHRAQVSLGLTEVPDADMV